jgi:cation diffusion facilitator CzcD-associated flavoprotein CzcO
MKEKFHPAKRPRVVIVGAGFGGLIGAMTDFG